MADEPWRGLLDAARADPDAIAVLLFGSAARGESAARDHDLAVVLRPEAVAAAHHAMRYAEHSSGRRHEGLDVSIFQTLPLYIRVRALQEHRLLWVRVEAALDLLYDVAWRTVKEWEAFRPHYEEYLQAVADG